MYATFCGHRNVDHPEQVAQWLHQVVTALIEEGNEQFYLGGYGEFDQMAAREVRFQKQRHPQVRSILVTPYLSRKIPAGLYDETVYPPLETVPPKLAILRRNQWVVEHAETVVAYVLYDWGGAAAALQYAEKKKKRILRYPLLLP